MRGALCFAAIVKKSVNLLNSPPFDAEARKKRPRGREDSGLTTNISAYQFTPLQNLKVLRAQLLQDCRRWGLKGTILLAPEGINLFVAGPRAAVDELLAQLKQIPGLAGLNPKFSMSQQQPFRRMLVRLKKEIIAFGVEGVDPQRQPAPRLPARTLKAWLDEKRPLVLLDTRNHYEVRMGTFRGALPVSIETFRQFPEAARALPAALRETPVVAFCTGGIRCEKAAPLLQQLGFRDVWQLEGGILRYFEEVGADHFEGECFVFDRRVGVDPALSETDTVVCFACQAPLTPAHQAHPHYRLGISCPFCFQPNPLVDPLERRQQQLIRVCRPLPGSQPAENRRPLRIPGRLDGLPLGQVLEQLFPHIPFQDWIDLGASGRLLQPNGLPADLHQRVRAGEQFVRVQTSEVEPNVNANLILLYEDEALVVLNKPAPLPMHSCGRFHRNTLRHILQLAWHPQAPRPVHRLDANTTGLVLCARTQHFDRLLQAQFARGEVEKHYLVRVHGHPQHDRFEVTVPIAEEAGPAGARLPGEGRQARTEFAVRQRHDDGTSLLEARLHSGRTNQIRAHLWHCGYAVVGDPTYGCEGLGGRQTLNPEDPPMYLHSWKIALGHPLTGNPVSFSVEPPWPSGKALTHEILQSQ
jgi:RluA family pseudouridine synthase